MFKMLQKLFLVKKKVSLIIGHHLHRLKLLNPLEVKILGI